MLLFKKIKSKLFFVIFFILVVPIFIFLGINEIQASGNVYGWAWTENIGWISFNRNACPADTNVIGGGGTFDYGVNIGTNGYLSGYAWSENIGWINFSPTGPYPTTPNYSAYVNLPGLTPICPGGDYNICGWVRACSVFNNPSLPNQNLCSGTPNSDRGGWDGWIRIQNNAYLDTSSVPVQFRQWFWGGNIDNDPLASVIGWGTFNCKDGGVYDSIKKMNVPVCLDTTANSSSNYRVVTTLSITDECVGLCHCNAAKQCVPGGTTHSCTTAEDCQNEPPTVTTIHHNSLPNPPPTDDSELIFDYCNGLIFFQWLYVDTSNSNETRYQIQVDDDANFA